MVVGVKLDSTKKKKISCAHEKVVYSGGGQSGLHQEKRKEVVTKRKQVMVVEDKLDSIKKNFEKPTVGRLLIFWGFLEEIERVLKFRLISANERPSLLIS